MNNNRTFYENTRQKFKFSKKKKPLKRKPKVLKMVVGYFNKNISRKKVKLNYYILRKNKIFIKNKYPRNRQWSKNIIYFGMWLNILLVYFSYLFCYHYALILNYLWWIIFIIFYCYSLKLLISFTKVE